MFRIQIPIDEMNSFDLPKICLISGTTDEVEFRKTKFTWYPKWVTIFLIVTLIVGLILAVFLTRRAKGELPFNTEVYRNWKIAQGAFALSVVVGTLFTGISLSVGEGIRAMAVGWGSLVLSAAFPYCIWAWLLRNKSISVERIDKVTLTIKVPKLEVALAFKRHLTGGRLNLTAATPPPALSSRAS